MKKTKTYLLFIDSQGQLGCQDIERVQQKSYKYGHLRMWWGSSLSDSEARVDIEIRDAFRKETVLILCQP